MRLIAIGLRCFFAIFFLSRVCGLSGKGFEVSGVFENTIYRSGNDQLVAGYFHVAVDGQKWRIRTTRTDETVDYFEGGSNGDLQIYLLCSHTNTTALAANEQDGNVQLEVGFAEVMLGEVPHFGSAEQLCVLWLAYASGSYFESRGDTLIEPVFWFGGRYFFNKGLTLPGDWTIENAPPYLPSRVVYYSDGMVRLVDLARGMPITIPADGPYAGGFTNAVFEASSYRGLGELRVPQEVSLRIFKPEPKGRNSSDLLLYRWFNFRATNISTQAEGFVDFTPNLRGATSVRDHRMSGIDGFGVYDYLVTNRWLTTNEVRTYGQAALRLPKPVGSRGPSSVLAPRVILVGLILVSVYFGIVLTKKQQKERIRNET